MDWVGIVTLSMQLFFVVLARISQSFPYS